MAEGPVVGVAVGRSSPSLELASGAAPHEPSSSILVHGGYQVSARADVSIADPVRLRIEGSTARWDAERQTYDPARNYQLVSSTSVGHFAVRQIGAAIGLRGGRFPTCAHVLVGGGLYSLTFRDATLRRPGVSITAGMEVPTGERGRVQIDVQLHIIDTNSRFPVSDTTGLAAAFTVGWAYRF